MYFWFGKKMLALIVIYLSDTENIDYFITDIAIMHEISFLSHPLFLDYISNIILKGQLLDKIKHFQGLIS